MLQITPKKQIEELSNIRFLSKTLRSSTP